MLCFYDNRDCVFFKSNSLSHIRIFRHYIPLPLIALGLVEIVLLVAALLCGSIVGLDYQFFSGWEAGISIELLASAVLFAVVLLACTSAMGVYSTGLRDGTSAMAVRTVVAYCLLGCFALTVIYYFVPMLYMGRGVLASSVVIALLLVIPARWIFLRLVGTEALRARVLVLGVGRRAKRFADDLAGGHGGIAKIVGFVQSGENGEQVVDENKIIQHSNSLLKLALKHRVGEIVVALDDRRAGAGALPLDELFACKMHGIKVNESISVSERELGIIQLEDVRPGWLVFAPGFYSGTFWRLLKRATDILVAIVILAVALPFMLLTAVAIYLETGSPVIYRQVRVGLEGRHFEIYKFRSMTVDAEKDGKAVWASKNDARVTRVGAIIRNTRLDELPQLVNVLKGDMSIVGPRPERPAIVEQIHSKVPYYNERHHAKPGLMGWAQLNYPYGASIEDAAKKLRYDLYYVKNRSFLLDLIIMVQTVQVVLLGIGVR